MQSQLLIRRYHSMIINASAAKQIADDANSYEPYCEIADAIRDAAESGEYSCQFILSEQCTKDAKKKYREILEELGYKVEVERHLETDDWGQGYYNVSIKIRWDE